MTIATESSSANYVGNGVTTVFPYPFKVNSAEHLVVIISDADDANQETLILDTDYTVSGVGVDGGGNVTYPGPLPTGWNLSITRVVPLKQLTDLENQGGFFPQTHEDALDYGVQISQQLQEQLSRTPQVSKTSGLTGDDLMDLIFEAQGDASAAAAAAVAAQAAAVAAQAAAEAAQAGAEAAQTGADAAQTASEAAQTASEVAQAAAEAAQAASEAILAEMEILAGAGSVRQFTPIGDVDGVNVDFQLLHRPANIEAFRFDLNGVKIPNSALNLYMVGDDPWVEITDSNYIPQETQIPECTVYSVFNPDAGSTPSIFDHTITAGELAAKEFVLDPPPFNPTNIVGFIPDGMPQLAPLDFVILDGNKFNWDGKNLDGILEEGTRILLNYTS